MAMREEFERVGNSLFRWRSYLPLIMFGIFVLSLRHFHYLDHSQFVDQMGEIFCLLVSLFGLGIRAWTVGHTPRGTSGRNTKSQVADTLNTTGIYSIVRNPLYLGNFFIGLGLALFAHVWWLVLIYTLAFWLYYERIIYAEETFLRSKFGDEFDAWAARTPAFVPRFRNCKKSTLSFSLRNVLRREYNGFFAIIIGLFILEVVGDLVSLHRFELDPMWMVLLIIGFVVWTSLRTLKKYTTLLNVDGR
jgi:protein-S-isoprenylcysteine O-methyltransferase Ste14